MYPDNRTYPIDPWSGKTFRARKNHVCARCGGIILSGVLYNRDVIRKGLQKGKDPLENRHFHLDCEAPWYQPELTHRLKQIGRLRKQKPGNEVNKPSVPYVKPMVYAESDHIGHVHWKLPDGLAERLTTSTTTNSQVGMVAEYGQALTLLLTALVDASGDARKAMRLSHLLNELSSQLLPTQTKK